MAILHRLLSVGGQTPGFLIPIFKIVQGANNELIQRIDQNGRLISLEPVAQDAINFINPSEELEINVGELALWAFRDSDNSVHIGNTKKIRAVGKKILSSGSLDKFPMAAAELLTFCEVESQYPSVLLSAYNHLNQLSPRGAEVWRDAVVLRTLILRDLTNRPEAVAYEDLQPYDLTVVSRSKTSHIYIQVELKRKDITLPRWKQVAAFFGINSFEIHRIESRKEERSTISPEWYLMGAGGVARYVIARPPFKEYGLNLDLVRDGVVAQGASRYEIPSDAYPKKIVVAILTSNARHIEEINRVVRVLAPQSASRHAINVRPIGFGTPRKDKISPEAIRSKLDKFDCVWLIANHRQMQTGSHANSMSVMHHVSRLVKAAAIALTRTLDSQEGRNLLAEAEYKKGFGLFGAIRYDSQLSLEAMVRRVLASMICEDAYLHTATKIQILWPYNLGNDRRVQYVSLGSHDYKVEISSRSSGSGALDVIGFATNVILSSRTTQDFFDFCVNILAGLDWELRYEGGSCMLFERRGVTTRVWPVISLETAMSVIWQTQGEEVENDLIVTNQSISSRLRDEADRNKRSLIHYSELSRHLNGNLQDDYGFYRSIGGFKEPQN